MEYSLQLIEQAKNADPEALTQLWNQYESFICLMCKKWFYMYQDFASSQGQQLDDLKQAGFLALVYAAKHYDATKGPFIIYLKYSLKREIRRTIYGPHIHYKNFDGKKVATSSDVLNQCCSLQKPIEASDGEEFTLEELLPDPEAEKAFQTIEENLYIDDLRAVLIRAMWDLSVKQREVLRRIFFYNQDKKFVAQNMGLTIEQVNNVRSMALSRLRKNPRLRKWYDEELSRMAWRGTGLQAWKRRGSAEEIAVECTDSSVRAMLRRIHY